MKHKILDGIGLIFTDKWVKDQGRQSIADFRQSAELCLQNERSQKQGLFLIRSFFCAGIILAIIDSFLGGALIALGAIILNVIIAKFFVIGNTSKSIAKKWKPLRKRLQKEGVIKKMEKLLKGNRLDYLSKEDARRVLVTAFDHLMACLSHDLKESERDGLPEKEYSLRLKMLELESLAKDLGLEMNFDNYFLSQRKNKETVRVVLRFDEVPLKK